jgi:hypothetical protein
LISSPEGAKPVQRTGLARLFWLAAGFVCVGLGGIGVVVPGMPVTGFFVAAAGCFSRSSPRFEQWVLNLPGVGPLVRDYRAGLGMPVKAKYIATASIVVACGFSAGFAIHLAWVRLLVAGLGLVGIVYIWTRVPTRPKSGTNRPTSAQ